MTDSRLAADSAYLINVAEAIQQYLLPELSGAAHARAMDCLNVTLRTAVSIASAAQESRSSAASAAAAEALAWQDENRRFDARFDAVTQLKPQSRPELSVPALQAFLQAQAAGGEKLRVVQARLLAGGRSKLTGMVTQEGAAALPRELVIRQDWVTLSGSSVRSEFGLLQKLWQHGITVAEPLLLESAGDVLGAPFIVVARVQGEPNGNILTPSSDAQQVLDAAETLGRLHGLGDAPFGHLPGISERHFTHDQLRATLATFRGVVEQFCVPRSALLGDALDWLDRNVGRVTGNRVLVHGDYGFHNLLFKDSQVAAVLDWELSHLGNPAYDLGYLRAVVEQRVEWSAFLQRYRAAGGPEVDAFTVDWYAVLTGVWLYHILLQARAGVVAGMLHDIEIVTVCAHIGPPLLCQIARLLDRAKHEHGAS